MDIEKLRLVADQARRAEEKRLADEAQARLETRYRAAEARAKKTITEIAQMVTDAASEGKHELLVYELTSNEYPFGGGVRKIPAGLFRNRREEEFIDIPEFVKRVFEYCQRERLNPRWSNARLTISCGQSYGGFIRIYVSW